MYVLGIATLHSDSQYSATLIEHMSARHQELRPEMKWLEMDVLDLKFEEGDFDLVVDKGQSILMRFGLTSRDDGVSISPV